MTAALTAYRDGLTSIFEQTVEGIRTGERQMNAIARNDYLTFAQYLLTDFPPQ